MTNQPKININKKRVYEAAKYLMVGGANASLTFLIYFIALKVFEWNYLLALVFAWTVGVFFTYTANFLWVFRPDERFRFNIRFRRYIIISSTSIILNLVALRILVTKTGEDPFWIQVGLMIPIVVLNFIAIKFWSMRKV